MSSNTCIHILAAILLAIPFPAMAQTAAPVAEPSAAAKPDAATAADYVIGNDDVLAINVWKEPDLTRSIPVRSDGRISLPLVGELEAAGKTPAQLQQEITTRLKTYIAQPSVTVMVAEIKSQRFNVLGRVAKPGAYPLSAANTVLDGIAAAGGFQDFAKQRSVYILRTGPDGKQTRLSFNYKDVIKGKHPEENVTLQPRDTIVVP